MPSPIRLSAACAFALLLVPAPARAVTPSPAGRIVDAWAAMPRDPTGNLIDPVSGLPAQRYSQAMLADAALRLPAPSPEQRAFAEGLLRWLAGAGPQTPVSVFE